MNYNAMCEIGSHINCLSKLGIHFGKSEDENGENLKRYK